MFPGALVVKTNQLIVVLVFSQLDLLGSSDLLKGAEVQRLAVHQHAIEIENNRRRPRELRHAKRTYPWHCLMASRTRHQRRCCGRRRDSARDQGRISHRSVRVDFAFGATTSQCCQSKDPEHHEGEQPGHGDLLAQCGR
jgi:hypothetical protein